MNVFARVWDAGTWVTISVSSAIVVLWIVADVVRWWQRRQRIRRMPARGEDLDRLVQAHFGFKRYPGETDKQLRARCNAMFRAPRGGWFDGEA